MKPAAGLSQHLRSLYLARDDPSLFVPLRLLGCTADGSLDLEPLRRILSNHVLVLQGQVAEQFWHVQVADGRAPSYRQVACFGCTTFAIHGSCEHVHAAWLHSGHICMDRAEIPVLGNPKKKRQQVPSILRRTQKRARSSASAPAGPSAPSDGLKSLLTELGFASFWPSFFKEQVNISILASWDLAAMKAYFPDIGGGPASQILRACKQRVRHLVQGLIARKYHR